MLSLQLKRLCGPALIVGGLFWIAANAASMAIGLMTGKLDPFPDAHSPALVHIGIWFLPLGVLFLSTGLLGIFARLEGRARGLGITGMVFVALSIPLAMGGLITIFTGSETLNGKFTGFGAFAAIIGSGFLGWAALRAHTLPRWLAIVLLITGFVTVPFIFATPLPVGPDWATDTLGFLLSALVYIVAGVTLATAGEPANANAEKVVVRTTVPAK